MSNSHEMCSGPRLIINIFNFVQNVYTHIFKVAHLFSERMPNHCQYFRGFKKVKVHLTPVSLFHSLLALETRVRGSNMEKFFFQ